MRGNRSVKRQPCQLLLGCLGAHHDLDHVPVLEDLLGQGLHVGVGRRAYGLLLVAEIVAARPVMGLQVAASRAVRLEALLPVLDKELAGPRDSLRPRAPLTAPDVPLGV